MALSAAAVITSSWNLAPRAARGAPAEAPASCRSDDPNRLCIALKYVIYKDPSGQPAISENDAQANLREINSVFGACHVGFEIEDIEAVSPLEEGLNFDPLNTSELDPIRRAFASPDELLIVTTGAWDRAGTLGSTPANAWTSMPGGPPYGSVLEAPVGNFGNIVAHELGHYLGLQHVQDASDLMNPVIYSSSRALTPAQCQTVRETAESRWSKMLR